jgi:hypothetical protein
MRVLFKLAVVLFLIVPTGAIDAQYGLPAGARIIETRTLSSQRLNRAIILWMLRPKKHPLEYGPDEYTCPDYTRGSYYSGPTRVSLADIQTKRIINTILVKNASQEDSLDVPYKIKQGLYYEVNGVPKDTEGPPTIIAFKDYNGDGRAQEFALFDAPACMGLQTTLIGYSERKDKVIQYPITLSTVKGKRRSQQVIYWIDYLFSEKPKSPGHWKFEIDYRGRGGTLDQFEIRYSAQTEMFSGTLNSKE